MPGVVIMENGIEDALSTNHDREANTSINGITNTADQASPTNQQNAAPPSKDLPNGVPSAASMDPEQASRPPRMNDLPDEIQHITQNYVPVGLLLSRLAQKTHNQLQTKILELAKMQVAAPMLNGNAPHPGALPDDTSVENISKKAALLNFIQDLHGRWTKALVITSWSRKAATVSKLIDLMSHMGRERKAYDDGLNYLANIKRDLTFSRLPNPDLTTALQVLSTGDASWMPDLGYIEPPPLTSEEQLKWIDELNTLLSLRLNVEDHDKIPYHFRDYTIDSGRVTFKVDGEFEVDLTIADEDFEKQFWFLDFRFSFSPAPTELTEALRAFLESRVNEALEKEGLKGCYNYLHEFVLTHKISEYMRQAQELVRGAWAETLKIERLHRSMAIQYWINRYPPESPKSWLILGVHSGRKAGAILGSSKATSHLSLRWFRGNKEVQDAEIQIDGTNVNTEDLLKKVIGRHIEYMLSAIHGRLQANGRFQRREAALSLSISHDEPAQSNLKMQLGFRDHVTVRIAPTTGLFSMTPQRSAMFTGESRLNSQPKDPTDEGAAALEVVRCLYTVEEMNRRGRSMGWASCRNSPVKVDELKPILQTKEAFQHLWFKRRGWPAQWFMMMSLSLAGDRWWLIEVSTTPSGPRISNHVQLPLSAGTPDFTDRFFSNLTVFSAAMISHLSDMKTLYQRRIKHDVAERTNSSLPPSLKIPAIVASLADVLNSRNGTSDRKVASWARDHIQIMFKGIDNPSKAYRTGMQDTGKNDPKSEVQTTIADARFRVADRSRFSLLKGNVEQDVAFNPRLGVFALRLRAELGTTMLDDLANRIQAIERLVDCVDAIRRSNRDINCETISLARVVFTYSDAISRTVGSTVAANIKRWKAALDLRTDKIKLSLEKGNPHLRALDSFNRLLNSSLGFSKVPQYLAFTLPVLKALDAIEDSWEQVEATGLGRVEIFVVGLDSFTIRYTMPAPTKAVPRQYHISVRLKERRGSFWWHVARLERSQNQKREDAFTTALTKVWAATDKKWTSHLDSASCEANNDALALLKAVDDAVRAFAKQPQPVSPLAPKQAAPRPIPKTNQQPTPRMNNPKPMQAQTNRRPPPQQGNQNLVVIDDDD